MRECPTGRCRTPRSVWPKHASLGAPPALTAECPNSAEPISAILPDLRSDTRGEAFVPLGVDLRDVRLRVAEQDLGGF